MQNHSLLTQVVLEMHALIWPKENNPLYRDTKINEECLEENPFLPFNIEHVQYSNAAPDTPADPHESIPFQNPIITDIEYCASSNELRAAGFCPPKKAGALVDTTHDRMMKMNSKRTIPRTSLLHVHSTQYLATPRDASPRGFEITQSDFEYVALQLTSVSPKVVQQVSEHVASGKSPTPKNEEV
ncbi:hypothetical protein B0H14DRAFT_2556013 [Mycena olivaceomarginata]|nr:hypothetical protein B0H14DRAFT_2600036 [Mycena olivaceomarginata]KAJ7901220.1 hypothetical protein B0H14DRAFT_2555993 [Mycena olivaceomarginata]KAJ7901243.1 hypothetical protein B0H14DRAFT_2556013 [Mycena olivaceomarginata]